MLSQTLIVEIQAALQHQERSVAWLARKLNKPDQWLWRRFSGEVPLNLRDLEAIANAMDMHVEVSLKELITTR